MTQSPSFFDDGLNGAAIVMPKKSFQRGLKELIGKAFLYLESPNQYWVNTALFLREIEFPLCLNIAKHQRTNK